MSSNCTQSRVNLGLGKAPILPPATHRAIPPIPVRPARRQRQQGSALWPEQRQAVHTANTKPKTAATRYRTALQFFTAAGVRTTTGQMEAQSMLTTANPPT